MPSTDAPQPTGSATVAVADLPALDRFAIQLAACLPANAVICLEGDLGAGKTTLVKAVAAAVGIAPADVTSPTFSLIQIYDAPSGDLELIHADMYRLNDTDELRELGWEELLEPAAEHRRWVFIEWPQRITTALPAARLAIAIAITGETARQLTITGFGAKYATIPAVLATLS